MQTSSGTLCLTGKGFHQRDYSAAEKTGSISGSNTGDQDLSSFATKYKRLQK
jgi:hypothetical protein